MSQRRRIFGFRRFAALYSTFEPGSTFSPELDQSVEAMSLDQHRELVDTSQPASPDFSRLCTAALTALRAGTISAAEILEHTRPAAVAVSLAEYGDPDALLPPGERRAMDDIRVLIAPYAAEQLGGDPQRWWRAFAWVNKYAGTLPELLADTETATDRRTLVDVNHAIRPLVKTDAANILLALALGRRPPTPWPGSPRALG